mmetsp:Transcript_33801/g.70645  ORF Transcript_33801/g.70645 Transcript_33801/m.70645 type:complete len:100 (+) Transcript_33801:407-706(+)
MDVSEAIAFRSLGVMEVPCLTAYLLDFGDRVCWLGKTLYLECVSCIVNLVTEGWSSGMIQSVLLGRVGKPRWLWTKFREGRTSLSTIASWMSVIGQVDN